MIGRILRLSAAERGLALRALVALAAARLALRLLPFRRVRSFSRAVRPRGGGAAPPALEAVDRALSRAARLLPGSTCLARSLAGAALLRRGGLAAEVRLGVARDRGGGLRAHAWVACAGRTLSGGDPGGGFAPLAGL